MKNIFKRLILATLVLTAGVSQAWFENISIKRTSAKVAAVVAIGAAACFAAKYFYDAYVQAERNKFLTQVSKACASGIDASLQQRPDAKQNCDAAGMTHEKDQMGLDHKPVSGLDQAAPTQADTPVLPIDPAAQSHQNANQSRLQ